MRESDFHRPFEGFMALCGSLRWNILYPNYINSKKTVQEGRRIGLEKAVEHPRAGEMAEVCE